MTSPSIDRRDPYQNPSEAFLRGERPPDGHPGRPVRTRTAGLDLERVGVDDVAAVIAAG